MQKLILTLLVSVASSSALDSPLSHLAYKTEASVEINLIWSKSLEYIEGEQFKEASTLLGKIKATDLSVCSNLYYQHDSLMAAIAVSQGIQAEQLLARFVITGILIDLKSLVNLEGIDHRKALIKAVFRELIAIQRIAKKYEYARYKKLIILLRRLHILVKVEDKMRDEINQNELILKHNLAC